MSRPSRSERLASKGRPKRRAAATHFFKYQLANNPSRAEEIDLKRALQESLEEQHQHRPHNSNNNNNNDNHRNSRHQKNLNGKSSKKNLISSTNSSDVSRSHNSTSSSNLSADSISSANQSNQKRNRSASGHNDSIISKKRARLNQVTTNGHNGKCDASNQNVNHDHLHNHNSQNRNSISNPSPTLISSTPKGLKTYSRGQTKLNSNTIQNKVHATSATSGAAATVTTTTTTTTITTSNNNARANSNPTIALSKTNKQQQDSPMCKSSIPVRQDHGQMASNNNDCSSNDTLDLSEKKNQHSVKMIRKRLPPGSWSLIGVPEEKTVILRDDEPPKRLICYPAIRHVEGDVIQVRDSVLLRSGARKTDLPYIAKVSDLWQDAETGGVMMSLLWYYRPEHTEEGRKAHHLPDEIFASRHRDADSVECIEDKCYVLTFNEYCRYRKRCKMEQVNTSWSLSDVTIPVSNEPYPRRNRIPDSDVNPELVFCCRQIYDSRMRRLVKNPLINPKYGHI